jgi:hypothetical protein
MRSFGSYICRPVWEWSDDFLTHKKKTVRYMCTYIFFLSLDFFPDYYKSSLNSPIHKALDPSNILNYRPISLLSLLPKWFEELASKRIIPTFNACIRKEQHDFINTRFTNLITNLLTLSEDLFNNFSVDHQIRDRCNIYRFFQSLRYHQPQHFTFQFMFIWMAYVILLYLGYILIHRFLCTDHMQFVKYKNFYSKIFKFTSGIPQRSHLASILFLLYIIDIYLPHLEILLFANDLKIYCITKSH